MVAGPSVVARVVANGGALVLTEDRLDRGVDVQVQDWPSFRAHGRQAMLGHQRLEVGDGFLVETAQVAVDGVDARYDATGDMHEERVARQGLDAEHALLSRGGGIDEQPQLRLHGVDHQDARLQAEEQVAQADIDAQVAHEHTEPGKAAEAGQAGVRPAHVELARVRTANPARTAVPISALASERISTHLLGAWRG